MSNAIRPDQSNAIRPDQTEKIVGEKTYTGRYLVLIDSSESQSRIDSGKQPSQVSNLVQMIKGQVM